MKHLILILLALSLSACATGGVKLCGHFEGAACISAPHYSWVNNPQVAERYLETHVPKERLKRWKRAISDDKLLIQYDSETGTGTAY